MIPRHQTILFFILLAASIVMGVLLWQLRNHAHERLLAGEDSAPTTAPEVAPSVEATLLVASDQDNSLVQQNLTLPLPQSSNARAQAILGKLLDLYAAPNAAHPVPGGASSIAQVFVLSAPSTAGSQTADPITGATRPASSGSQMAVINFTGAFAASHPSGLEAETLTLLSICATLHANLPNITEVRFLVDGHERPTLAGHADLSRTYLAADATTTQGTHP